MNEAEKNNGFSGIRGKIEKKNSSRWIKKKIINRVTSRGMR